MGYDAFGLNAENAAIKRGPPPAQAHRAQHRDDPRADEAHGLGDRLVARDLPRPIPTYYRWTQWLFLRFYEKGLAYRKEAPVKWCPKDQTVLANEQVIDGRCERCGTEVEARNLTQWFFRITDYADALLDEMSLLEEWPERVLTMQRNWIGRSEGARVLFKVAGSGEELPVFTTRPDTLFGATFFVLAPEHPLIESLVTGTEREAEVRDYARHAAAALRRRPRGEGEGRRLHGPLRREPGERRGDSDLGRRLRSRRVRHRRDHGRPGARRARLRLRTALRVARAARRRARRRGGRRATRERSRRTPRMRCWSTPTSSRGLTAPEGKRAIVEWLVERGLGEATIGYPPTRLAALAAALLGLPDSDHPLRALRRGPRAGQRAAGDPARDRGLPPQGPLAPRRSRGLGERRLPSLRRRGAARDRHDGHVRRFVLVLPPLLRPATTTSRRSRASWSTTGCRSTSTSAGSSTPSSTCCTHASSRR